MTIPVVLPANFMEEWSTEDSRMTRESKGKTPGVDSEFGLGSRVTESGFTEETARRDDLLFQAEKNLEEAVRQSERTSRIHSDQRNPYWMSGARAKYENEKGEILSVAEESMKIAEGLRQININQKNKLSEEDEWRAEADDRYVTMADFTEFTRSMTGSKTVTPGDSVTVVNRRDLMPLSPGGPSKKLSGIMESEMESTVIGGFSLNSFEKIREVDSYANINPVRGLAKIFVNDRLNFLSHIHSALFKILTKFDGEYPAVNSMDLLLDSRKTWDNDPSTLLLETVIDATIDRKTGEVKANPFSIPILEPTMILNEKLMHMALDQLHREFEIEWFNTMKDLTTPNFQSKYEARRFRPDRTRQPSFSSSSNQGHTSSGSRSRSGGSGGSSAGSRKSSRKNSTGGQGSIIGMLMNK
jgi:uncharacterized membrane protein YgcG